MTLKYELIDSPQCEVSIICKPNSEFFTFHYDHKDALLMLSSINRYALDGDYDITPYHAAILAQIISGLKRDYEISRANNRLEHIF